MKAAWLRKREIEQKRAARSAWVPSQEELNKPDMIPPKCANIGCALDARPQSSYCSSECNRVSTGRRAPAPVGTIVRSEILTYVVPAGTAVMMSNESFRLKDHRTRKDNKFPEDDIVTPGGYPPLEFAAERLISDPSENVMNTVTLEYMAQAGFMAFATKNRKWPIMFVPHSIFTCNVLRSRS